MVVSYTVVGSLFIPFPACTLPDMNNRIPGRDDVPRNGWLASLVLCLVLLFLLAVGVTDIRNAF